MQHITPVKRIQKIFFTVLFACITLCACREDAGSELMPFNLGDQHFCIPKEYFTFQENIYADAGKVFSVQFTWPDMLPLTETRQETVKQGHYDEIIRVLARIYEGKTIGSYGESVLKINSIQKNRLYGLEFYTTLENYPNQDGDQSYIGRSANGTITSVIMCTRDDYHEKHNSKGKKVCKHSYAKNGLRYNISYSKKRLPEWMDIEERTVSLINEFRNSQSIAGDSKCRH